MRLWLTVLILSLAGCRSAGRSDHKLVALQSPPPPINDTASSQTHVITLVSAEMPLTPDAPKPVDPPSIDERETIERPVGAVPLTLDRAIAMTLQCNPSLVAIRQNMSVGQAALEVARSYPYDPSVQVTVMPKSRFADGHSGSVVNSVQIMQTVELAHQHRYRRQAGRGQLSRTRWDIVEAELHSVAETQRRFFAVLYHRKLHGLRKTLADLNEELLGVLRRRFDAGQATGGDVALAEMEARSSRQQAELAETAFQFARWDLQAYLGIDSNSPCVIAGNIEDWSWLPAEGALAASTGSREPDVRSGQIMVDEAVDLLVAGRPDVKAARADLQTAVAQCKLASASRVPNIDVGPVYERNEDKTVFLGVAAQMAVPLFGSKRAMAFQRGTEVRQKRAALQQLRRRASIEIEAALSQYERGRRMVKRFHADGDKELTRQVQLVKDLFEAGQADLLRVYAARSQAFQVRMDRLQALDTLARAASDLIESSGIGPEVRPLLLNRTRP